MTRLNLRSISLAVVLISLGMGSCSGNSPDQDAEDGGAQGAPEDDAGGGDTDVDSDTDTDADGDSDADQDAGPDSGADAGHDSGQPSDCDATRLPIVFVHGMIDAGGTFANSAMRFAANGYCLDRIFAFDWNTTNLNINTTVPKLAAFIQNVLQKTGASKIDLIGHSMGGNLCSNYLTTGSNAQFVAHYGHLASNGKTEQPGGVPTICLSSADDAVAGASNVGGAVNVKLTGTDHLQVVTAPESFWNLYKFFTGGEEPATTEIVPEEPILLSGRIVSLGQNFPGANFTLDVYEVDPATGERLDVDPVASFTADAGGYFGPFEGRPGAYYEFYSVPVNPAQHPVHYYREPFVRSNNLVYLRVFPGDNAGMVGQILGRIPYSEEHAVLLSFTANQSVIAGRDTLTVDGYDMATAEICSAANSTIAIFFFDDNANTTTDATRIGGIFQTFPFLEGFDMYIPTSPAKSLPLVFNGRTLSLPNRPSLTEGVVVASFD